MFFLKQQLQTKNNCANSEPTPTHSKIIFTWIPEKNDTNLQFSH